METRGVPFKLQHPEEKENGITPVRDLENLKEGGSPAVVGLKKSVRKQRKEIGKWQDSTGD